MKKTSTKGTKKGLPASVAKSPANTKDGGKMAGVRSTTVNKKY